MSDVLSSEKEASASFYDRQIYIARAFYVQPRVIYERTGTKNYHWRSCLSDMFASICQ